MCANRIPFSVSLKILSSEAYRLFGPLAKIQSDFAFCKSVAAGPAARRLRNPCRALTDRCGLNLLHDLWAAFRQSRRTILCTSSPGTGSRSRSSCPLPCGRPDRASSRQKRGAAESTRSAGIPGGPTKGCCMAIGWLMKSNILPLLLVLREFGEQWHVRQVVVLFQPDLHQRRDLVVPDPIRPGRFPRRPPRAAVALHFAALHGEAQM